MHLLALGQAQHDWEQQLQLVQKCKTAVSTNDKAQERSCLTEAVRPFSPQVLHHCIDVAMRRIWGNRKNGSPAKEIGGGEAEHADFLHFRLSSR